MDGYGYSSSDLTFRKVLDILPCMNNPVSGMPFGLLNRKEKVIAGVLARHGIMWSGIPEAIVDSLHVNGYRIKRRKGFKNVKNETGN